MKNVVPMALLLLGISFVGVSFAEVYEWTDPEGNTVYSDQPRKGSKKVELKAAPAAPAPLIRAEPSSGPKDHPYRTFRIVSPNDKGTVVDADGQVEVEFELDPRLFIRQGHKIAIRLDGEPVAKTTAGKYQLTKVRSGEHRLHAQVTDADGHILSDGVSITFYLRHP